MATWTTPAENELLVRQYPEEGATEGNVALIEKLCTTTVVDYSLLDEVQGRDDLEAQIEPFREAFGDSLGGVGIGALTRGRQRRRDTPEESDDSEPEGGEDHRLGTPVAPRFDLNTPQHHHDAEQEDVA